MIAAPTRRRSLERGNRSLSSFSPALARSTRSRSPVSRRKRLSPVARSLSPIRRLQNTLGSNFATQQKKVLRTVSADRDRSYFNILGTDGLVSTDSVLQQIKMIRDTKSITKLEFEDVVCRKQNQKEIFDAIQELLSPCDDSSIETDNQQGQRKWGNLLDSFSSSDGSTNEDDDQQDRREWTSVKFQDTILVLGSDQSPSSALSQLGDYEKKQKQFWDLKIEHCAEKTIASRCLIFQAKIMVEEGCSIESLLNLMEVLQTSQSNLEKVQFGGGLFGYSESEVPKKLVSLFRKDLKKHASSDPHNNDNNNGNNNAQDDSHSFFTSEMVMMNLLYAAPDLKSREVPEVIPKCINRMINLKTRRNRERSVSPKPKRSRSSKSPSSLRSRSKSPKPESPRARSASPKPSRVCKELPKRSRSTSPKPVSNSGQKIRLDRIKEKNTIQNNTLAVPSAFHSSQNPYQRQNSNPQTEGGMRAVRRNALDFPWDKMGHYYQGIVQRSSTPSAA